LKQYIKHGSPWAAHYCELPRITEVESGSYLPNITVAQRRQGF